MRFRQIIFTSIKNDEYETVASVYKNQAQNDISPHLI